MDSFGYSANMYLGTDMNGNVIERGNPLYAEDETVEVLSDNLFDKSTIIANKGFYHSSSGTQILDSPDTCISYVHLKGSGTYRTKVYVAYHGEQYAARVPLLKEDKTFIQNITGTIKDTGDKQAWDLEFTVTESMVESGAAYYPITVWNRYQDTIMFVKDIEYPSTYQPYGYITVNISGNSRIQNNCLFGKTALFFGDSICAGTTVGDYSEFYGFGWAGLIGSENGMVWKNYGRNGGTIANISTVEYARQLSGQLDLATASYPEADYIIFEGGCNDADILGLNGLGDISTDFATFNTATFTGALESIILRLIQAYPHARIGYIVAQKMGMQTDFNTCKYRVFFDRAVEVCEKWGIPYLDLWKASPLNPKLSVHCNTSLTQDEANASEKLYTDGQHLTLSGYQRISPKIESFMKSL